MKPTFVLVHGAWHTAACMRPLQDELERLDFPTLAITMPSCCSSEPKSESAQKDADSIRTKAIEPLLAKDAYIVLLLHSYGGIPGSGAVDDAMSVQERAGKGLKGGILGLIYMSALIVPANMSIPELSGGHAPFVVLDGMVRHEYHFTDGRPS